MPQIAFLGAGSVVFTQQLVTDLVRFDDTPTYTLALHDIDPRRLAVAHASVQHIIERHPPAARRIRVLATLDRREALRDAVAVVNMIQVGGLAATKADLLLPAGHGIHQTIGDTTGVGGVFRGLRTFPVLSGIARDMLECCPEAWLLNYTNPMTMNVGWLREAAPGLRTLGLCHSVYWTVHNLCAMIGVPLRETTYLAAGVNHQSWLLRWEHQGRDLYPLLREHQEQHPELARRVRFEIFARIGYFPTETSEHSAEYVNWFLHRETERARFRIETEQYVRISEANAAQFEATRRALAAGRDLTLHDGAVEYAPQLVHALLTGSSQSLYVNVPNRWVDPVAAAEGASPPPAALIDNLPPDAVVEVPCEFDARGLRPVSVGALPEQAAAHNRRLLDVAALTIRAMRDGNPELVRQALLLDANASSSATPETLWRLADELTSAHAALLPRSLGGSLDWEHR